MDGTGDMDDTEDAGRECLGDGLALLIAEAGREGAADLGGDLEGDLRGDLWGGASTQTREVQMPCAFSFQASVELILSCTRIEDVMNR